MKGVYIVGASGSIGTQTLDVIREYHNEFKVVGLSLGRDLIKAKQIIEEFKPEIICLREKKELDLSYKPIIVYGDEGLLKVASYHKFDKEVFVNALVGISGLMPTVVAINSKKDIALANKETLVVAGDIIKSLIKDKGVQLTPIDSEHSAILECLQGENKKDVKRLIITASGGSFRDKTREELIDVTKEMALAHPNWSMGSKITIDSATMMNKGFEVIEAHHLFDIPYNKIDTILHKESIVHSMVEYDDGVIKAAIGSADMHTPIAYALRYPKHEHITNKPLNLIGLNLHFEELSMDRYPCLEYAYYAVSRGGVYPAVLNASNEAAVWLFLNDRIKFLDIEKIIYDEIHNDKYESYDYSLDTIIKISNQIMNSIKERYEK
ncbi:MAG: 1-deoxy-D-xylulose-5-phosphate reductoisomerase [Acholeplasmatales bacterium]|nr:1-deoxy-D-xylulose-5-phosphate reductoisomerase [Acholeplasmatales bacterium]